MTYFHCGVFKKTKKEKRKKKRLGGGKKFVRPNLKGKAFKKTRHDS